MTWLSPRRVAPVVDLVLGLGWLLIGIVATYSAMVYGTNLPYVVATLIAFTAALNLPG